MEGFYSYSFNILIRTNDEKYQYIFKKESK